MHNLIRDYYTESSLIDKFTSALPEDKFEVINKTPLLHIVYEGEDYYVMLRNVSYAGNPHPKHRFRAQMPQKDYLENYKKCSGTFLFMGYDAINDVYVLWNPHQQRARINLKKTVSLFCERGALEKASSKGIYRTMLSNGGLYIAFTVENLCDVLNHLSYFDTEEVNTKILQTQNTHLEEDIIKLIRKDKSTLEIISYCYNNYSHIYEDWQYVQWRTYIKSIFEKMSANCSD